MPFSSSRLTSCGGGCICFGHFSRTGEVKKTPPGITPGGVLERFPIAQRPLSCSRFLSQFWKKKTAFNESPAARKRRGVIRLTGTFCASRLTPCVDGCICFGHCGGEFFGAGKKEPSQLPKNLKFPGSNQGLARVLGSPIGLSHSEADENSSRESMATRRRFHRRNGAQRGTSEHHCLEMESKPKRARALRS